MCEKRKILLDMLRGFVVSYAHQTSNGGIDMNLYEMVVTQVSNGNEVYMWRSSYQVFAETEWDACAKVGQTFSNFEEYSLKIESIKKVQAK